MNWYRLQYISLTVAMILMLGIFLERPAYGYADPGSSLLLFQSVSAFATAAIFYFRRRLKRLFTRSRDRDGNMGAAE